MSERQKRLALALVSGLTTSGAVTGLVVAAWVFYGVFFGGFSNLNNVLVMISCAATIFVVGAVVVAGFLAIKLWRGW